MHASDLIITKPGGLNRLEVLHATCRSPCSTPFPVRSKITPIFLQTHDMGVCASQRRISPLSCPSLSSIKKVCAACAKAAAHSINPARTRTSSCFAVRLAKEFASYNPEHLILHGYRRVQLPHRRHHRAERQAAVTKRRQQEHYYLPGGRVTMREKAEDALTRELKEELVSLPRRSARRGLPSFSPLLQAKSSVTTSFLCTYFTVDASGTDLITRGDRFDSPNELSVHSAWFPFEELPYIDLRPAF